MPRCQRLPTLGLCLALGLLLSACDPKPGNPPTPKAGGSVTDIVPAAPDARVDGSSSHKGPSEGAAAIGGMSGGQGGGATTSSGAAPAPTAGDGGASAPAK